MSFKLFNSTKVSVFTLNGSLEEGLARLAGRDTVVITGREVSAHQTQAFGPGVQWRDVVAAEDDGIVDRAGDGADGRVRVQVTLGEETVAAAVRGAAGTERRRAAERRALRAGFNRRINGGRRIIGGWRI